LEGEVGIGGDNMLLATGVSGRGNDIRQIVSYSLNLTFLTLKFNIVFK
jgi:hypothetical protein